MTRKRRGGAKKSHRPSTTTFTVSDGGALAIADFPETRSRAEVYDVFGEPSSGTALASLCDECRPLAWHVAWLYSDARDELALALAALETQHPRGGRKADQLTKRFASMPEEPEDGIEDWLLAMTATEYKKRIVPSVRKWLAEEPDWQEEADYMADDATARGAALAYWRDVDDAVLELLGIEIVEGEHPGSSYWAAELTKSIDATNEAAEEAGIDVHFIRA